MLYDFWCLVRGSWVEIPVGIHRKYGSMEIWKYGNGMDFQCSSATVGIIMVRLKFGVWDFSHVIFNRPRVVWPRPSNRYSRKGLIGESFLFNLCSVSLLIIVSNVDTTLQYVNC